MAVRRRYAVGNDDESLASGDLEQGWVSREHWDANVTVHTRWMRSFYWSLTTITTVGYGDVAASTNPGMLHRARWPHLACEV